MPPSLYLAYLNTALTSGGSETTVYVNKVTTLTGETLSWSYFSPFTKGYIVVDPENQFGTQPEIISFTGVDTSALSFTGATRGLSSVTTGAVTANKTYHGVGTPVIISWGAQNISDLITYVNGLVTGSLGNASLTTAGSTKLTQTVSSLPRATGTLVSQANSTGTMALSVNPFSHVYNGTTYAVTTATATATMVAPVSNPRIDLIVYSTSGSAVAVRTGTEAGSPTAPTPTEGDIILASVFHRVAETKVLEADDSTNGYIQRWFNPTVYSAKTALNTQQVTAGTDQSQATSNGTQAVGEANATTKASIIAMSFVPTVTNIQGVKLWKIADTGSFTGTVKISLQATGGLSNNSPAGSDLASYTITNAAWLRLGAAAEFAVAFSTEYTAMTVGSSYWIVVTPSTSDNSNHPNLGLNTAGGYAAGTLKYNNSTDGWVTVATSKLYFKTTEGILSRVIQTDSTSGLTPVAVRPYSFLSAGAGTAAANTVTETSVYSVQVEGGLFTATSGIHVRIIATSSTTNTGVSSTAKLYLGAALLASTGFASIDTNSVQQMTSQIDFYVTNTTLSAQNSAATTMEIFTALHATFATTYVNAGGASTTTKAVDTSATPDVIKVTFTNSSATNYTTTCAFCLIEKIG